MGFAKCIPRRYMLVSVGLIFLGLGIPVAMLIHWFPSTLFLCFVSLALIATGTILTISLWGEI